MKKIILIVALFLSVRSYSQGIVIADETSYTITKTTLKVVSDNDSISNLILINLKNYISGFSAKKKKDRFGQYNECTFEFNNIYYNKVKEFFDKINKK